MILTSPAIPQQITLTGQTANGTVTIPAGYQILSIVVRNTTANAITGGLRIGTTAGATDVVVALTVGASALTLVSDAAMLKRAFSVSSAQTLYLEAVVAWNSASINTTITLAPFV